MPRLLTITASAVALLALFALVAAPVAPGHPVDSAPAAEGELLVRLCPGAIALTDAVLARRLGAAVIDRLPSIATLRLRLDPDEAVSDAVARVRRLPLVAHVEPNHLLRGAAVPNDPIYSAQSGYLDLIQAAAAWDVEFGDAAVLVAVLDTGIDLAHPDLEGKVWLNPLEVAANGVDEDANGCVDDLHGCSFIQSGPENEACEARPAAVVDDDNGHGTFIAGVIAARGNNGIGLIGAAPGVTIVPVKILDCLGGGTVADAAAGILYAARLGARVANVSFSADGASATLAAAIREAFGPYGMVIVAATGNDNLGQVNFPARLAETIAVASSGLPTDPDARSPFSNWGPEVTVAAPGLNIIGPVPAAFCGQGWLCLPGEPYAVASGTSFAAPLVSALAALLVSHHPNLSPDAVRGLITASALPLADAGTPGWDGAGRLRMLAALGQQRFFIGVPGLAKE